ncbi:maleylpyruvate isomerase N-terminal domain-containing protein [Spongiactinospora sp. TRM90649]|uniref:maleylpyruvate isomerase N-terminal domain-containing protein n=1 Tax=Spongiactinospora sp. TRM90649 TaxID=3031114 RepID=UPI0023F6E9C7|nr:maleylpyruvate isomerase N-terminal domain-containing protein [Spongiactinospora sp. TRM90649]MDF5751428.1 maleylpyruvate isomerase N-terminal domain-containing protein [Spongiactinospora sp. TRM90649]
MNPFRRRSELLAAVRGSARRPASTVPPYAAPYASRVAALDVLLAALPPPAWTATVVHGWTPLQLVGHLMAVDGLLAAAIGAPVTGPPLSADDPEARTDEVLALQASQTRDEALARWREQAAALCERLNSGEVAERDRVTSEGVPMRLRDHITVRAFETWIHSTDIGAAVQEPKLPLPVPDHVHALSGLGCQWLPLAMQIAHGDAVPHRSVRVTLTGDGGGTRLIHLGPEPVEPCADVEMDVIDFCFLFGDRLPPEEIEATVSGDAGLARDLIAAAPNPARLRR